MNRRLLWPAGFSAASLACSGGGGSSMPPPNPDPQECFNGIETPRAFANLAFDLPVAMQQAPNDPSRWFLVEQGGRIRAFENDPDADVTEDFVDLRTRVFRWAWPFTLTSPQTRACSSTSARTSAARSAL
jgi:hypothetical protein